MSKQFIKDLRLKWKWSNSRKAVNAKKTEDIYTSEAQKGVFRLAERLIKNPKSILGRDIKEDVYYVHLGDIVLIFDSKSLQLTTPSKSYTTLIGQKLYSKVYDFYHNRNDKDLKLLKDKVLKINLSIVEIAVSEMKEELKRTKVSSENSNLRTIEYVQ